MSIKAIAWAWEQRLQPISKLVLLALADCSHPLTGATFPSIEHIQKATGLCRRSVIFHLGFLETKGLVSKTAAFDESGRQRCNDYVLLVEGAGDASGRVQELHPRGCRSCTHNLNKETEVSKKDSPLYMSPTSVALTPQSTTAPFSFYAANPHMIGVDVSFETFWSSCPKKVGKKDALKAFRSAVSSGEKAFDLISAMEQYRGWVERNQRPPQFVLNPATWIRQGRWNDELKDDENERRVGTQSQLFREWFPDVAENFGFNNPTSPRDHPRPTQVSTALLCRGT